MDNLEFESYLFDNQIIGEEHRYLILIIYDISDNKRRTKFASFLKGYGFRVQKSAFEAHLNRKTYKKLISNIPKQILPPDNVRVYKLNGTGEVTAWGKQEPELEDVIII